MKTFDAEQARHFIDAVRGDRLEALFTVAASVGLRQGEALGLRLEDVDLANGTMTVRSALQRVNGKLTTVEPKSVTSTRPITLPAIAVSAIAAHLKRRDEDRQLAGRAWTETGYLFTTTVGTPIDPRAVIRRFHTIPKANSLPRLRFHDLRHSVATLLLAQDVPAKYIAELLGHSHVSFTMQTYAHVTKSVRQQVANKTDEIFGKASR
jgi:integrase